MTGHWDLAFGYFFSIFFFLFETRKGPTSRALTSPHQQVYYDPEKKTKKKNKIPNDAGKERLVRPSGCQTASRVISETETSQSNEIQTKGQNHSKCQPECKWFEMTSNPILNDSNPTNQETMFWDFISNAKWL